MRLNVAFLVSTLLADATVHALVAPGAGQVAQHQPLERAEQSASSFFSDLWKRRGGGGSGGGRGGGSSSGGSSSGGTSSGGTSSGGTSSGGSTGGTSGSSGGGVSGAGRGGSSSTAGGRTTTGSGPPPAYGGGRYYGGGAAQPYKAGATSASGIKPLLVGGLVGGAVALAFWPGIWAHSVYLYPYSHPHNYYNASSKLNETKPVVCGCDEFSECGCDENGNSTYMDDVLGNGSYAGLNQSLVTVGNYSGKETILINGTLPNGTTAAGGDEDPNNSAGAGFRMLLENAGWWPVVATVCGMVFVI
ncbi:hypothetical protein B0T24DRAFT_32200 [Lasiosphaeria ovina]|uniref:DUF7732 domain-containing protein n=1 Tax=Lasiosphaeria ovina TaxID=92902 RepID=A0AAE0NKD1_9PEZI|nr:hypothetical protein B0T24DRAFT_32200 [Lasiosphaeria ovina]